MRVAIVYDCLHPWTIGGQERWMRTLSETLAVQGHDVTYLTRQQWSDDKRPSIAGVKVIAVAKRESLYDNEGNRHPSQGLRFARGVGRHLRSHRSSYDVIHTCAFPFFHLFAIRTAMMGTGVPVLVDWPEVWSSDYWRTYSGRITGQAGIVLQRACVGLTPIALTYSRTHGERLRSGGLRSAALRPGGLGPDPSAALPTLTEPAAPTVVFVGRHIREKRPALVVKAVAQAQAELPGLKGVIYGDGPEKTAVKGEIQQLSVGHLVDCPGFVSPEELAEGIRNATALVLPSSREGFGIVVLEATAVGTPVVVVRGRDNAAVELVHEGVNGAIADDADPDSVARAIIRVHQGGEALRRSTAAWYAENAGELSASSTALKVEKLYAELAL